jgi:hypothetical protein
MGVQTSKLRSDEKLYAERFAEIYNYRVHSNILIVGEKGAGKTALTTRINGVLGANKSWVHLFDSDTTDEDAIKAKIRTVYDDGVDVSGLSILASNLPLHGIIWVMDATKMIGVQDFDRAREILVYLRNFQRCEGCLFFNHTDLATRSNLGYIRGLYLEDSSIPNSGEFSEARVSYAPLIGPDRDADHTLLNLVKLVADWAFSVSRSTS